MLIGIEDDHTVIGDKGFDEPPLLEANSTDIDFQTLSDSFRAIRPLVEYGMKSRKKRQFWEL